MGCAISAPARIAGQVRDLTPSEMLDQVLFTQLESGPPVLQYRADGHWGASGQLGYCAAVFRAGEQSRWAEHRDAARRLSTCGVIPGIRRLVVFTFELTLSVSLHAPDSETRSRIMPVNRAYDVEGLVRRLPRLLPKDGPPHLL